jgi:putative SOS response-associated peptidase YedK
MFGRFNLIAAERLIRRHFKVMDLPSYQPSYNIAPGQELLTLVQWKDGSNQAATMLWRLISSWSKDRKIAHQLINARAETVAEKPSFRSAYKHRRCLIPAIGFYEWQNTETSKQPYHIHQSANALFALAGLWERWKNSQETVYSRAIITMAPIHTRMPVVIPPEIYNPWLDLNATSVNLSDFLASDHTYSNMLFAAISTRVNNPLHNNAGCLI